MVIINHDIGDQDDEQDDEQDDNDKIDVSEDCDGADPSLSFPSGPND